ncbi:hypothetical protein BIY22_03365 [Vibrio panuliri]|uniref:Uncharacterized protein n=1 Tax=Vibrio panuliri TaxID=1381081 RepID=A0A1Q9HRP1_9VIBR|nr:hypothetical protein [Vibrio panuliri]OLQ93544.1 hypothetical protein BIY22_03365 [Vibrio panuliri]
MALSEIDKNTNALKDILATLEVLIDETRERDLINKTKSLEQNRSFSRITTSNIKGFSSIANKLIEVRDGSINGFTNIKNAIDSLQFANDKLLPAVESLDKPVLLEGTFVDITKKANVVAKTQRMQDKRLALKDKKKENSFQRSMFKNVVGAINSSSQNILRQLFMMSLFQNVLKGFFGGIGMSMNLATSLLSNGFKALGAAGGATNTLIQKLLAKEMVDKPRVRGDVDFPDIKLDSKATMAAIRSGLSRVMLQAVPRVVALLNPITAIAALVATAGVVIYQTFEDEFDKIFSEVGALITDPERLRNMLQPLTDGFVNLYDSAKQWFIEAFTGIKDSFMTAVGGIGEFLSSLGITAFFESYFGIVKGAVNGLIGAFVSIPDYVSLLGIKVSSIFVNMKAAINSGLQSAVKAIEQSSVFKGINAAAEFFGADTIDFGEVNVFDGVAEQQEDLARREAELKASIEANQQDYVKQGFDKTVEVAEKGVSLVVDTASNVANAVTSKGQEAITALSDGFNGMIDSASNFKESVSTSLDTLADDISKLGISVQPEMSMATAIKSQATKSDTAQSPVVITNTVVGGTTQNNVSQQNSTNTRTHLRTSSNAKQTRPKGVIQ